MSHDYDVIVIGAGIGGLTAGALLANRGLKVLVIEQHSKPGGYCSTFRRGPFIFDVAVHLIGGCEEGGLVDEVLRFACVRDQMQFARIDPMYVAMRGNECFAIPADLREFAALLTDYAPREQGIKPLIETIYDIGATLLDFSGPPSPERTFKALARVANQNYLDFIGRYVTDERVLALLSGLAIYAGLPPSQIDAGQMITILMSYHRGAFYPLGSTQTLANAFVESIKRTGGAVQFRTKVSRILMKNNAACGVELPRTGEVPARAIISNADVAQTLFHLIGEEHLSAIFVQRFRRLRRAASAVNLYLALQGNPNLTHHEVLTLSEAHPRDWQIFYRPGRRDPPFFSITSPTLLDPSLAPAGCQTLAVNTLTDMPELVEQYREEHGKEAIGVELLSQVERFYPTLRSYLIDRRCEVATPRTLARYTSNTGGSIYGWGKGWDQHWPYRLGPRTPVAGLYIAGHWTRTHGIYGVVKSGKDTAAQVEKDLNG